MKKTAVISGLVFISLLFISQGLFAQRYYRSDPGIEEDYCYLNLTQEQMEKVDKLEIELEKEVSPMLSMLRSHYIKLDELEDQRSPNQAEIKKIWELIYDLEEEIQNKEIGHEKKLMDLLTEDQKAILESSYSVGMNYYGRRGFGRFGGSRYGYGQIAGRLGRGNGRNMGYVVRGAGRASYGNVRLLRGVRYGRGPCGAGLGRLGRQGYRRIPWNWDE